MFAWRPEAENLFLERGESEGGEWWPIAVDTRVADDGKRLDSLSPRWEFCPRMFMQNKGRGLGRGWVKNFAGAEAGGFLFGP